jgi:hypothetical protein
MKYETNPARFSVARATPKSDSLAESTPSVSATSARRPRLLAEDFAADRFESVVEGRAVRRAD